MKRIDVAMANTAREFKIGGLSSGGDPKRSPKP